MLPKAIDMELDRLTDERDHLVLRRRGSDATGKVRNVSSETAGTFLDDYQVLHLYSLSPASPACFRTFLDVPGGTSVLGLPDTVTVPDFQG